MSSFDFLISAWKSIHEAAGQAESVASPDLRFSHLFLLLGSPHVGHTSSPRKIVAFRSAKVAPRGERYFRGAKGDIRWLL